jgi:transcriptional regulator with XRE-family HTH domain
LSDVEGNARPKSIENGRRLRALRVLLGMRQQDVAERARVHRKTVCRAELGHVVHPLALKAIERVLGVEVRP